ncbi:MAG: DUF4345 domain-containing protein [Ferruginibacter sp.]|nr:DUF4345 domain-containing protein [Chitinophagaceae bacterium]
MRNLHLIISSIIILPVALAYGFAPSVVLPVLFAIKVDTTDLQNIFRAMMGLYLGMVIVWVAGILNSRYWKTATIVNIFFMGGLATGRLISFVADGMPSALFIIGFFAEASLAALSYFNWTKYKLE